MTDNEIIKALECCGSNGWGEEDIRPCDKCPMQECEDCEVELPDYALNLINRQKAEIDRLKFENLALSQKRITMVERVDIVNDAMNKAIREFAVKLLSRVHKLDRYNCELPYGRQEQGCLVDDVLATIDNLVKEMTEDLQ